MLAGRIAIAPYVGADGNPLMRLVNLILKHHGRLNGYVLREEMIGSRFLTRHVSIDKDSDQDKAMTLAALNRQKTP